MFLRRVEFGFHNVLAEELCFNPNVAGKVTQFFFQMANSNGEFNFEHGEDEHIDLSDTECKIIAQIGHGYSNKENCTKIRL